MSDVTSTAADVYHATQEVKDAIDTYNKYCNDFNHVKGYDSSAKVAYIGIELMKSAEKLLKLNVPLTGDPQKVIDTTQQILDKYRDVAGAQSIPINDFKSDPFVKQFFEDIPKKPIDNSTCPTIDYPIPPVPYSRNLLDDIKDAVRDFFRDATRFVQPIRRDPLTLDLDGDGLETVGTYTRTDGSTGNTGEVSGTLGDIDLAADVFHRQFTDHLDTSAVASLPDMQGSRALRDLRATNDETFEIRRSA